MRRTVVLHVAGVLVDDAYHRCLAWQRAFADVGVHPSLWRVHRALGAGPSGVVKQVGGDLVAAEHGTRLLGAHEQHFDDMVGDIRSVDGARGVVVDLVAAGFRVILAGWDTEATRVRYANLLGLVGGDVEHRCLEPTATADELVAHALAEQSEGAVVVSDNVWGLVAATRLECAAVAVRTGAYSAHELRTAGADHAFESLHDLHSHIESTALARPDAGPTA